MGFGGNEIQSLFLEKNGLLFFCVALEVVK
jgi:hypothetical protein